MTPEHAKALLPIITAYAEGKTIESLKWVNGHQEWRAMTTPAFNAPPDQYRVKPATPPEPPHGSVDAMTWAQCFVAHARVMPDMPADTDAVFGWFANAMAAAETRKLGPPCPPFLRATDVEQVMTHVRSRHLETACGSRQGGSLLAERDTIWAHLHPDVVQELLVVFLRHRYVEPTP